MAFLVIEDDSVLSGILKTALATLGEQPVTAETLGEADLVLETVELDGVVLDLDVGSGTLDWLVAVSLLHPPLSETTLVLAGDDVAPTVLDRVTECGAMLLRKPFTPGELGRVLRECRRGVEGPERRPGDRTVPPRREDESTEDA
jgi:DNA-binding response OmpR family regulator